MTCWTRDCPVAQRREGRNWVVFFCSMQTVRGKPLFTPALTCEEAFLETLNMSFSEEQWGEEGTCSVIQWQMICDISGDDSHLPSIMLAILFVYSLKSSSSDSCYISGGVRYPWVRQEWVTEGIPALPTACIMLPPHPQYFVWWVSGRYSHLAFPVRSLENTVPSQELAFFHIFSNDYSFNTMKQPIGMLWPLRPNFSLRWAQPHLLVVVKWWPFFGVQGSTSTLCEALSHQIQAYKFLLSSWVKYPQVLRWWPTGVTLRQNASQELLY